MTKYEENEAPVQTTDLVILNYEYSMVSTSRLINLKQAGIPSEEFPAKLEALARQHTMGKGLFNKFEALEKKARDFLDQIGVKVCVMKEHKTFDKHGNVLLYSSPITGRAINPKHITGARLKMQEIEKEWEQAKEELAEEYDERMADVIQTIRADKDWRDFQYLDKFLAAIEDSQVDWDYIDDRLNFSWNIIVVGGASEYDEHVQQDVENGLVAMRRGCVGKLVQETCKMANEILEKAPAKGKQPTIDRVRKLADRLEDLAFLDQRLWTLARGMQDVVQRMPKEGPVTGGLFQDFLTLLSALKNQKTVWGRLDSNQPLVLTKTEDSESEQDLEFSDNTKVSEVVNQPEEEEPVTVTDAPADADSIGISTSTW